MTFVEILREEFEKQLQSKTGWGRNEVLTAFDKACISAMIRYATTKGFDLI